MNYSMMGWLSLMGKTKPTDVLDNSTPVAEVTEYDTAQKADETIDEVLPVVEDTPTKRSYKKKTEVTDEVN